MPKWLVTATRSHTVTEQLQVEVEAPTREHAIEMAPDVIASASAKDWTHSDQDLTRDDFIVSGTGDQT